MPAASRRLTEPLAVTLVSLSLVIAGGRDRRCPMVRISVMAGTTAWILGDQLSLANPVLDGADRVLLVQSTAALPVGRAVQSCGPAAS